MQTDWGLEPQMFLIITVTVAKCGGGRTSKVKAEPQIIAVGVSESLVDVWASYNSLVKHTANANIL